MTEQTSPEHTEYALQQANYLLTKIIEPGNFAVYGDKAEGSYAGKNQADYFNALQLSKTIAFLCCWQLINST